MLRPLEEIFLKIILFFHTFTHNYGWDIILLTLLIRIVLFPIFMMSMKSMKKMQVIQPQLKALQAKYKDDREKFAREQMKLFKEAGVNPVAGCFPLLLQMPVLWALFQVLRDPVANGFLFVNADFYGLDLTTNGFGRITDATEFLGGLQLCHPGMASLTSLAAATFNFTNNSYLYMPGIVLVVVFLLSMFAQQKMMQVDPSQQNMMMMMNVMFSFIGFTIPMGVLLYWDVSNVWQFVQQKFTNAGINPPAVAAGKKDAATADKSADENSKSAKPKKMDINPHPAESPKPKGGSSAGKKKRKRKR